MSFGKDWENSASKKTVILSRAEKQKVQLLFSRWKDVCRKNLAKCTFVISRVIKKKKATNPPTELQGCTQTTSGEKAELTTWAFLFQQSTFSHGAYLFPSDVIQTLFCQKEEGEPGRNGQAGDQGALSFHFHRGRLWLLPLLCLMVWKKLCMSATHVFSVIWRF